MTSIVLTLIAHAALAEQPRSSIMWCTTLCCCSDGVGTSGKPKVSYFAAEIRVEEDVVLIDKVNR